MSEMIKDQETSSEQGNVGRRRLVRGAVSLAPLVLTLRSGAATASCTGARLVEIDADGKFSGGAVGEVCIDQDPAPVCPNYSTAPGATKVLTEPTKTLPVTEAGGGKYYCGETNNHITKRTVAILSSDSAKSLTGGS